MGKMKNLFFALMFTIFSISTACERDKGNQVTIQWDAVTTRTDGTPLPANSTIQYELFIREAKARSGKPKHIGTKIGTKIEDCFLSVTPPSEGGPYLVGIKATLMVASDMVSDLVWSDDPAVCKEGGDLGVSCTL
jgi:hypothetical protein